MNCDCELPEVGGEATLVKARKQHTCCECKLPIEKGQTYTFYKGMWDGVWKSYHICQSCEQVRGHLEKNNECCIPLSGIARSPPPSPG